MKQDEFLDTIFGRSKTKKMDIKITDIHSDCTLFESRNERGDKVMKRVFEILKLK